MTDTTARTTTDISSHADTVAPVDPAASLAEDAAAAGLRVVAAAAWPETAEDQLPPPIAGFVVSSFSPLAAEAARRCLARRRPSAQDGTERPVTAVVVVSPLGDLAGAVHVAETVDSGGRVGPLLFFQAVPNAVAGHVAALWRLTGPVVCVADTPSGMAVASLLLADLDADEALLIRVDQAHTDDTRDRAAAVLLHPGSSCEAPPHGKALPHDATPPHGSAPHDREGEQP